MSDTLAEPLADRILGLIAAGELTLPPFPDLPVKLRTAIEDESTSVDDIARLVRTEPAVAASLLRLANSAAFGGLKSISDLSRAVGRLGMAQVQTLVIGLVAQTQFSHDGSVSRQVLQVLWNHAVASATVARLLAVREGYPTEVAFVAGLLHGFGRLIVLRSLDQLGGAHSDLSLTQTAKAELADGLQYEIGYSTLRSWNLEHDVCEAARAMDPDATPSDRTRHERDQRCCRHRDAAPSALLCRGEAGCRREQHRQPEHAGLPRT